MKNRRYVLASRPGGQVTPEHFRLEETEIPVLTDGEVLVKTHFISVDPFMRNRMNAVKSYVEPYELGGLFGGDATGIIEQSKSSLFSAGELVMGPLGWQEYAVCRPGLLTRIDLSLGPEPSWLGVLGLTGLTAYFGLLSIGQLANGDTVVVSGAAGAVGSVAGQIARIKGCHVVGITGSEDKVRHLVRDLKFDDAVNYRQYPAVRKPLMKMCPEGIDIYFDNVGGEISDNIFYLLNDHARIVLCGQISQYNEGRIATGPRLFSLLLIHRAKMQGFIVYDYRKQFTQARNEISGWLREGSIVTKETVVRGFENLPSAFLGLFRGENIGKQLVLVE